jgi:tetratricopeptide (TPR) repeat protein
MAWSLDAGQVEVCLRLAGSLIRFWSIRGVMDDERRRLERALAVADGVADSVLAKASFAAGYAALSEGAYEAADGYFERSLSAARAAGDRAAEGAALAQVAWVARARGRQAPAQEAAERALLLAEEAGDKVTMSGAYSVLAEIAADVDEPEEATRLFEHALRLRRELGDRRLIASSLIHLARRELPQANRRRTTALLGEGEEIARAVGDTWSISLALSTSATLKLLERDVPRAARLFGEALELAHQRGDRRLGAECLLGLAATQAEDEPRKAARLLGAARALREGADATASSVETVIEELAVPPLREKLGEEYAAEEGAGALLDPEKAIVLALEEGRAAVAL